jgi:thiol-disulfide isomerase/thioredoxin
MRTPWRRSIPVAILATGILTALTLPRPRIASARPAAMPEAGDPQLIDLSSYRQVIAEHRGKGVLVNFWATWCQPCREEYPMVVNLAKEYGPQGLDVIGITLDEDADMNLVRRFLSVNRPPFPNYRQKPGIDADAFYQGVNPDWRGTMPETNFYGRDGHLARYFVGMKAHDAYVQAIRLILEVNGENRAPSQQIPGN